ncbi:uncharacterized protein LOC135346696 [Halichondria panicea]|uniref:uncharacterized protein LOC135346696 n=1 Tax=Halichondria panicea TaxID=6063 RepID=UPI00312B9736
MAGCCSSLFSCFRSRSPRCTACGPNCRTKIPKIPRKIAKIYFAAFLAMFSSAFSITMMFPFLPFMVEFLLPWLLENETQVATYAGIIASAMFVGRTIGSYIWGAISDRKGRKPVIIVGLLLVGLSSSIFGLSVNFAMAVIFRFLVGLTNGSVGAIKAVVSEVSDDSTQAFGVTILGASWGLGIILGPAVSGSISDPIGQYNLTIDNYVVREFLTRFPYSLPCLVNLLLCVVSAVVYFFMVPETLGLKRNLKRSEISKKDIEMTTNKDNSKVTSDTQFDDSESAALIVNEVLQDSSEQLAEHSISSADCENGIVSSTLDKDSIALTTDGLPVENVSNSEKTASSSHDCNNESIEEVSENTEREELSDAASSESSGDEVVVRGRLSWGTNVRGKSIKISLRNHCLYLWDRNVSLSLLMYCTFSFALIGWNEVFPVWAKTSPHLGGLGFSLREIGLALTIDGVVFLPFSLFLYPLLEKKFGSINACYGALIVLIPFTMLIPNIHYLSPWRGLLWFVLCLTLIINQICIGVAVSCSILFINNSVTFDKLGTINGLATSLTSFGRSLAPVVAGGMFSLSLSATMNGYGYPIDYRFVFLMFGLTYLLCVLFVACLPVSINKQKIIED